MIPYAISRGSYASSKGRGNAHIPNWAALIASMARPLKMRSFAFDGPNSLVSRAVPPALCEPSAKETTRSVSIGDGPLERPKGTAKDEPGDDRQLGLWQTNL